VATNTRFTEDAKDFAKCSGMRVVSWDYPADRSLRVWVDESGFYPVTALHSLKKKDKEILLQNDVVLCRELESNKDLLFKLGFNPGDINKILAEAKTLIS